MSRAVLVSTVLFLAATVPAGAQDTTNEELLERIRNLEQTVEKLESGTTPTKRPDGPKEAEAPDEPKEEEGFRFDQDFGAEDVAEDSGPIFELPGSMKLSLTGRIRVRTEFRDSADYRLPGTFGRPATDDQTDATDFTLLRTRIGLKLDVVESVRAVIEIQDSRTFGDVGVGADRAEFHLYSGYIDVHDPFDLPLDVWVGRTPVPELGDSRLISALDFSNVGRSWDAVEVLYRPKGFWIKAFLANIREGAIFSATGDENDDFTMAGVYASMRMIEDHEFDVYVFWRHLSDRVFLSELGRLGDRKDFTFGFRVKGKAGPIGYTAEFDWQEGDQAGDRVSTYAGAARAWFKLDLGDGMNFTVTGEYAYAKGDRRPADGKVETFDPLLPFGHFYHGHMDLIGWSNVHAGMLGLKLSPAKKLSFHADTHVFLLDERKGAWIGANKVGIRQDPSGRSGSLIGTELDLYVKHVLLDSLHIWGGYSHFFDGAFVRNTGRGTDQAWWHLSVELKF